MGVISADNTNLFKTSDYVFSKVKRFLSSYNAANLIDEGEFGTYVKEVLRDLGIGVYKETDAVLRVKNYKARLPEGFTTLYAAYKCTPYFDQQDRTHYQGGVSVFNDVTWELLEKDKYCGSGVCDISFDRQPGSIIEKISVRQYVKEEVVSSGSLTNPILLRLSPNVKKSKCSEDCENLLASSPYEISIEDGFIMTNFNDDCIYMKYYEFPLDENGVPMIPDIEDVQKTIEWYIIYQLLLKWFINGEVPDLQNRWQFAQQEYEKFFAKSKYYLKLPSFLGMVNQIRRQRSTNLLTLISQQG